jgi:hypothetical protein
MNFSFGDMKLSVAPIWSWPFVLLCCAAMIAVVAMGYPRRIRHLISGRQKLLLFIRAASVLLLLLLMLRPSLVLTSKDHANSVVYVLRDVSRSMQTPDGPGSATRIQVQRELLGDAEESLVELSDTVEVRHRSYAETLRPEDPELIEPDGLFTSLSNTLDQLYKESAADNVALVLLIGDGRQAAWGDSDRDPVSFARMLGKKNSPVYPTVIGTSDVVSNGLDVSVSELDVTRDVFVRNVVPVKVRLKANGASGRPLRVRVLLEQPPSGDQITGEMVPVPGDQQSRPVHEFICDADSLDEVINLQFVPQVDGEYKVGVEVVPLDDEVRTTNNRIETLIRIRKGGIRVAYFDKPRPEAKWLKSITVSDRVQLDFQKLYSGRFADRNQFDESWFEPGNFDAFIIGDVPADVFGKARLENMRRCCEEGAGLMMTGGFENFGNGGYQQHRISELFPIDMAGSTQQLTGLVPMRPTDTGEKHAVMQIDSQSVNRERWKELPPLTAATLLKPLEGSLAQVLARTDNGTALLVAHEIGKSRVMAFGGDTTWHWCTQREWGLAAHQRFWRQAIFWLTRIEQDTDGPVWVTAEPKDLVPGQSTEMRFGARDAQGLPIADAEYTVTVTKPDGTTVSVLASSDQGTGVARFSEVDQAGDYSVRVEATHNGNVWGWAATRFLANASDPELDNPSADPEMMRELAYASGGDFLSSTQLLERLEFWAENGLPGETLERNRRVNLWDNWYSLLLFTALLTFEWGLRKKSGLV